MLEVRFRSQSDNSFSISNIIIGPESSDHPSYQRVTDYLEDLFSSIVFKTEYGRQTHREFFVFNDVADESQFRLMISPNNTIFIDASYKIKESDKLNKLTQI